VEPPRKPIHHETLWQMRFSGNSAPLREVAVRLNPKPHVAQSRRERRQAPEPLAKTTTPDLPSCTHGELTRTSMAACYGNQLEMLQRVAKAYELDPTCSGSITTSRPTARMGNAQRSPCSTW